MVVAVKEQLQGNQDHDGAPDGQSNIVYIGAVLNGIGQ